MARYSKTFAHVGRAKRADYERRRKHALACLALVLTWRTTRGEGTP